MFMGKKNKLPTVIVYLFSYFFILLFLVFGFYIILKGQILRKYEEKSRKTTLEQLDLMSSLLEDELNYLSQLDSAIITNPVLISYRYKPVAGYQFRTVQELKKHLSSISLVQSVVYLPIKSGVPFSTMMNVDWSGNKFQITVQDQKFSFDPVPYLDAVHPQLILLSEKGNSLLIYFPVISSRANYMFFYTLDLTSIKQELRNILSETVIAVALVDNDMRIATGMNADTLSPYLDNDSLQSQALKDLRSNKNKGFAALDSDVSVCYHTVFNGDFTIMCMLSNNFLESQINSAFYDAYWALLLLGLLGVFLIVLAMRFTYIPLHRLVSKIVPSASFRHSHLNQLEEKYSESYRNIQTLSKKLESYRRYIKKSSLDSILLAQSLEFPDFDLLFDPDFRKNLYMIHLSSTSGQLDYSLINTYFAAFFGGTGCFNLIKKEINDALYLINDSTDFISEDPAQQKTLPPNRKEALSDMLNRLYSEAGVMSAVSQSTDSPLDIPLLYENSKTATKFWPEKPVAFYNQLPCATGSHQYPYQLLQQMNNALQNYDFPKARDSVDSLFQLIDSQTDSDMYLMGFYVQCILVDILTNLVNCMNQNYIPFDMYSDLYFSLLNLCHNHSFQQDTRETYDGIKKLQDICEQEISKKQVKAPFKKVVEECYVDPDFSLEALADRFHVSLSYMSQWFRLELGCSFSEYLWNLRLKKAQELLLTTEMTVDEISIAVGYLNTSSFRRKFKQEMGITPSKYRTENSKSS